MQYPAEARSIEAAFLDDGDDVISFTTNSLGGRKCLDTVFSAIKVRASGGEENFLFPVVKLDSTSYEGQNGTVFNPIFEIVDWMDMEGKRESDTAKLTSEPETEEAQPTRTRRKRSA